MRSPSSRPSTLLVAAALLALLAAGTAPAQTAPDDGGASSDVAFGVRAGYTHWDEVDQFHFGAHLKLGEILPNVRVIPGIEIGLGSGVTVITVNGDVVYDFTELVAQPWNLYGGASLALVSTRRSIGDDGADLGLGVLAGLERTLASGNRIMFELRVGLVDSPDLKAAFGFTLY